MTLKAKKDDAALMFRKYARLGLNRRKLQVFEAYAVIRGVSKNENEAQKLLAVYDTVRLLKLTDDETASAVEAVYFYDGGRSPKRSQISGRVLAFATERNLDERSVYRRLHRAKELYYHLISEKYIK